MVVAVNVNFYSGFIYIAALFKLLLGKYTTLKRVFRMEEGYLFLLGNAGMLQVIFVILI